MYKEDCVKRNFSGVSCQRKFWGFIIIIIIIIIIINDH
uniref:Uncharacterized protein n=1 Tax=Anguilla anguilla TaxID=7936 RepID=A0A0E9UX62_ANGAN